MGLDCVFVFSFFSSFFFFCDLGGGVVDEVVRWIPYLHASRERGQRAFNPRSRCHSCHGPRGADVLQMPEGTKRSINHFQPDDSPLHLLNPEERLCEAE